MTTSNPKSTPYAAGTGSKLDETRRDAKEAAGSLAEDAKDAARDAADSARTEVQTRAEDARHGVAGEVGDVAAALRQAADASRTGSPQERTFGQIAEGLADVSETIANKDLGEMAGDVSDFARRNPLVFLGGAALVGFAATRFAKAGRPAARKTDVTAVSGSSLDHTGRPQASQPVTRDPYARTGGVS